MVGGCRKLHNFYSSPTIIRNDQVKKDEMGGAFSTHREQKDAYRILVGKIG
jgi:hypothetical protein